MRSHQFLIVIIGLGGSVLTGAFLGCAQGGTAGLVPTPLSGTGGAGVGTGGSISGGVGGTSSGGSGAEGGAPVGCGPAETLCAGLCVDVLTDRTNCGNCGVTCEGDGICNAGVCECPYTLCGGEEGVGGVCVNTSTSLVHCGACYNACRLGEACTDGACVCQDASLTRCGTLCVNTATDPANCGGCGTACEATQLCSQSECRTDCVDPESRCDLPDGTAYCANLQTSAEDCGRCGNQCEVGYACVDGVCDCAPGTELCEGTCVDTQTTLAHCGGCGPEFNCTHICEAGECVCEGGLTGCGTECVDVTIDNAHCGTCDAACLEGSSCSASSCTCDPGLDPCEGVAGSGCTDLQIDDVNCGSCGNDCGAEASCDAGTCVCDEAGLTFCTGECADLDVARAHCGGCGDACPEGQICQAGGCIEPPLVVRSTTPVRQNEVNPSIRLCNQSAASMQLTDITIRYWYTVDGTTQDQRPTTSWFEIPASITAEPVDPVVTGADFQFTIAITGSPSLAGNNTCFTFSGSVHGTEGWISAYDVTNDYSYLEGDYVLNERIAVYQDGELIWGTEPTR